jgi:trk system potassium uptake protein
MVRDTPRGLASALGRRRWSLRRRHPTQVVAVGFAVLIGVGTLLLSLPGARAGEGSAPFRTALFTAASAGTTTGLVTVDTSTYWSRPGQVVILALIQLGGFGILASASLLLLVLARGLNLRGRLAIQLETGAPDLGSLRRVLLGVGALAVAFEAVAALALALRLGFAYDEPAGSAAWEGVFHGVSAFNNGGFALYSDSFSRFAGDPGFLLPIMLVAVAGGLGFPVWTEIARELRTPRRWGIHTRLTLVGVAVVLLAGVVVVLAFEWSNGGTLGGLSTGDRILSGAFAGTMTTSAGFSAIDYGSLEAETLLVSSGLMFIGLGSASTAGGIKVTTAALLILVVWSELRGRADVVAFRRRVPPAALRQALALTVVAAGLALFGTLTIMLTSEVGLGAALFEATSAAGALGLSTGITPDLSAVAQYVLVVLMFLGRVGPLTLGIALILRERQPRYRHPEDRPIVG